MLSLSSETHMSPNLAILNLVSLWVEKILLIVELIKPLKKNIGSAEKCTVEKLKTAQDVK